jgi:hypothetical protein
VEGCIATPKIGPVLGLIAVILVGVAVIAVAAVVLLRSAWATERREARYPNPEQAEREVYENIYGKRSKTVSGPLPSKTVSGPLPKEAPLKADADSPRTHEPSADPRPWTHRRSRAQDSHR